MAGIMKDGTPYFFGSGESYSTEEQVIGTWIDGKPIYRKVIEVESLICTTVFNESTLIEDTSNINIKSNRGSVKWGDSIVPFPFYFDRMDTNTKILIDTSCYNNKFVLRYSQTSGIQQINIGVSLIIEYTKTTD